MHPQYYSTTLEKKLLQGSEVAKDFEKKQILRSKFRSGMRFYLYLSVEDTTLPSPRDPSEMVHTREHQTLQVTI